MSIVKVKTKGQVTLPTAIRERAGLNIGDLLEAKVEEGKITLTPKTLVDRHIAESIADFKDGRSYGPFDTVEELTTSLQANSKRGTKKAAKRSRRK
jgi:AbrB family looped-hinge helix DNA binding protein